jgi:hypothetical protein
MKLVTVGLALVLTPFLDVATRDPSSTQSADEVGVKDA